MGQERGGGWKVCEVLRTRRKVDVLDGAEECLAKGMQIDGEDAEPSKSISSWPR